MQDRLAKERAAEKAAAAAAPNPNTVAIGGSGRAAAWLAEGIVVKVGFGKLCCVCTCVCEGPREGGGSR